MNDTITCPICLNEMTGIYQSKCSYVSTGDRDSFGFECEVCGKVELSGTAYRGPLDPERTKDPKKAKLNHIQRAALSHRTRIASRDNEPLVITTDWLNQFIASGAGLPSPGLQAKNIIRFVGDEVTRTGEPISHLPIYFTSIIGAPNRKFAHRLALELVDYGLLKGSNVSTNDGDNIMNVDLSLRGWQEYDDEKHGKVTSDTGFIAMEFEDEELDKLVNEVIKPAILSETGYELVDMRDVPEAGVIDNIMRAKIRDSAFVISEVTHDNLGAYWEAGYAEGLGKPVIFMCKRSKFDEDPPQPLHHCYLDRC